MGTVLYCVIVEVAPESEQAWDEWNSSVHIPDLLLQPGFIGARKYRDRSPAQDGWPRYVIQYEIESMEALEQYLNGPVVQQLRQEHINYFGAVTRLSRQVLQETARF